MYYSIVKWAAHIILSEYGDCKTSVYAKGHFGRSNQIANDAWKNVIAAAVVTSSLMTRKNTQIEENMDREYKSNTNVILRSVTWRT